MQNLQHAYGLLSLMSWIDFTDWSASSISVCFNPVTLAVANISSVLHDWCSFAAACICPDKRSRVGSWVTSATIQAFIV